MKRAPILSTLFFGSILVACGPTATHSLSAAQCGFADCHTAQRTGAAAPCDDATYGSAVAQQIDGSIEIGGAACDGNYLVLNLGHRTCADTSGTPCLRALGLAFFVAQDAKWTLITYGRSFTCSFVAATMEQPHLPNRLCTQALRS